MRLNTELRRYFFAKKMANIIIMKHLLVLNVILPLLSISQMDQTGNQATDVGIHWTERLTWEQVKEKAKHENKYIFIDAYATWCGPCKKMDKEVYSNDTVGNYFNDKFISVKIQMDKTDNDNVIVQNWYNDAASISKQYRIEGYPCFIFLSPQGGIVHKEMGYKAVKQLLEIAQASIQPGKVYDDPYAEYDRLVADYNKGIKHYDRMIYMSKTALQLNEEAFAKQLLNEHTEYLLDLKPKERYTKEIIEYWGSFMVRSNKPRFWFFYKDGYIIDRVMNKKGYAQAIVDRTIQYEIVDSFFKSQPGGAVMASGMMLFEPGKIDEPDYTEANWNKLYKIIREKYGLSWAKRNVLEARLRWYDAHKNFTIYAKYFLIKLKSDPPDFTDGNQTLQLNGQCWNIFRNVTDKKLLVGVIKWIAQAVQQSPKNNPDLLDTYANLLYKSGRKAEAIRWQEKALLAAKGFKADEFAKALEQMKRGERTHVNAGVVWE